MGTHQEGSSNFTKGLTDAYLSRDLTQLEVSENLCLDSDFTTIQRPGSSFIPGSDANGAKHASQNTIKGLSEFPLGIISSDESKIYLKTDSTTVFSDTGIILKNNSGIVTNSTPGVNCSTGAVTHDPTSLHVNSASMSYSTPVKTSVITDTDNVTNSLLTTHKTKPLGLQRFPSLFTYLSDHVAIQHTVAGRPATWGNTYFAGTMGGTGSGTALTFNGYLEGLYTKTYNLGALVYNPYTYGLGNQWIISDRPETGNFTYRYRFCFTFFSKYKVGEVEFLKESVPSFPAYLLTNIDFQNTPLAEFSLNINYTSMKEYLKSFHMEIFESSSPTSLGSELTSEFVTGVFMYMSGNGGTTMYRNGATSIATTYHTIPGSSFQVIHAECDSEILQSIPLYTTGGVLANDPPPVCKFVKTIDAYTYYGNGFQWTTSNPVGSAYIGTGTLQPGSYTLSNKNYVWQSVGNDPDSVPTSSFVELPDDVQGIGSAAGRVIVGTSKAVYRIDGKYDEVGGGLVQAEILGTETGVISHRSMVSVGRRCLFLGTDGVYSTDGVDITKISAHIDQFYRSLIASFTSNSAGEYYSINFDETQYKIDAAYDKNTDRVIWTLGDKCLVLEMRASDIGGGFGSFWGPWLYGLNDGSNKFQCISVYKNSYMFGDSSGYVRVASSGYMGDPRHPLVSAPVAQWGYLPILFRLKTAKSILNNPSIKKWASHLLLILKRKKVFNRNTEETLDIDIHSYNDGYKVVSKLKPVHYTGETDIVHDKNIFTLAGSISKLATDTIINVQRRFTAPGLRCVTKAIEIVNGLHLVSKSDSLGVCNTSGAYVSLLPTMSWPYEAGDVDGKLYVITFEAQNYLYKYVVSNYTASTLTVGLTPLGESSPVALPAGGKWKLYTYSSRQFFGISGLSVSYTPFQSESNPYRLADQGGNSGDKGE